MKSVCNPLFALFVIVFLSACEKQDDIQNQASSSEATVAQSEVNTTQASIESSVLVPWKEGTHYKVLEQELTQSPVVVEYFSFWCPACYNFEPLAKEIERQLGTEVAFQKVHVNFMGLASKQSQELATLGMAIARHLNNETLVNASIFSKIHQERQNITTIDDIKSIFLSLNVSEKDFLAAAESDEVVAIYEANNALIDTNREDLNGVPNFIVNGKYQATFTRDMNAQDVIELIKWLSQQQ
ncbi:thiol:disulfide interchange protein DsbA/DsbL [Glaciecola sp. MH2013]|uniref:thiol:disulfide interchange protein DsbA/DsbL n=1 Tax=Glaciecola sp. MH2013 TaxID=2785524 RepID=UPI00189EE168|nr:thiol:disulfide interchange protein DsbA/DsbL [Glaciecola sp. MH2013]MBF7071902.1 thiol:disulfide interchange protein DsbA/DsbL [Glaciecola sp. MH2013]